ncbi:MAG TPA: phosphatase PAP2 family protein [Solirubrobacterales bacterium]|nr:phosphatase PAP2 family protein [Solirubrobacterales bacterium]
MPLLAKGPPRLRTPPPGERRRRLRRLVEARRRPLGRLALAAGRADQALLVALRTRGHGALAERSVQALGAFGELGAGWAALGLLGAGLGDRRRGRFFVAAAAAPATVGINYLVKATVGRERPVLEGHPPLGPAPSKLSFPSAHAATSVAGAVALGRVAPRARLPLYGLAALICAGRPYLGMHYPSDVLAGAVVGWAIGRAWPLPAEPPPAPTPSPEPTEPEQAP